jgi:alkylation response protein AidB-like acyl-CoA dehydrogenase
MDATLEACLVAPPPAAAIDAVNAWWRVWLALAPADDRAASLAVAGGFAADRVGWAFASGYQAALRALLPDLPRDTLAALCVTEAAGNRPRDIRTTITPLGDGAWCISGAKRWTTLGPASTQLLVVGALQMPGADAGRPALKVARVPVPSSGLVLQPMPPTPFVPEVPHAQVQLHDVRLPEAALLPGDGYSACVKPFRTIEDAHVTLAVLAYLLREGRTRRWPHAFVEELAAAIGALLQIAHGDANAAATHVALAGALRIAQRLYGEASALWAGTADDAAARRWQRDRPLFEVAGAARAQRAVRAWERLGLPAASASV